MCVCVYVCMCVYVSPQGDKWCGISLASPFLPMFAVWFEEEAAEGEVVEAADTRRAWCLWCNVSSDVRRPWCLWWRVSSECDLGRPGHKRHEM